MTAKKAVIEIGEHRALPIAADVTDREGMDAGDRPDRGALRPPRRRRRQRGHHAASASLRLLDPADFDRVLAVNLTGVLNTVQPAVPHLIDQSGHVVVVASCAAFSPPVGGAAYMVCKAAVEVLSVPSGSNWLPRRLRHDDLLRDRRNRSHPRHARPRADRTRRRTADAVAARSADLHRPSRLDHRLRHTAASRLRHGPTHLGPAKPRPGRAVSRARPTAGQHTGSSPDHRQSRVPHHPIGSALMHPAQGPAQSRPCIHRARQGPAHAPHVARKRPAIKLARPAYAAARKGAGSVWHQGDTRAADSVFRRSDGVHGHTRGHRRFRWVNATRSRRN